MKGKVAIVTGTSGSLGPVWVNTLLDAGVVVMKIDLPIFDVTSLTDLACARERCITMYDTPDIIVNNAAIDNPPGSDASFFGNCEEILRVNLLGAVNVCQTFLPDMIKAGRGVIVNVGSIMGNVGADWRNYPEGWEKPVGYNLSKAGLVQLTRSIATQYGRYGIRSVCISFGPYDNGKFTEDFKEKFFDNVPLGRGVSKESLQATLLYACTCPELTGQQILIDGGYTAW